MAKTERNQGSVGRARAKRGSNATSRVKSPKKMVALPIRGTGYEAPRGELVSVGAAVEPTRPIPRPVRGGMESSLRPVPRPSTANERASADAALRASQREAADRDMGMKYGGKVKKMMGGGTCRGMGKATKGGNYSRG